MTRVKMCGMRRLEDIAAANSLMPEYIGFVFAPASRRYVSPEEAAALKQALFADLRQFADLYKNNWLKELSDNQRSFQPFDLFANTDDVFDTIMHIEPKKTSMLGRMLGKNLKGYPAIDSEVSDVSMKKLRGLDAYNYFMTVHEQAINNVIKKKYNI